MEKEAISTAAADFRLESVNKRWWEFYVKSVRKNHTARRIVVYEKVHTQKQAKKEKNEDNNELGRS